MATHIAPFVPLGEANETSLATPPRPWQRRLALSSFADGAERFLAAAGYDRGPWLVVAFAAGIAAWFMLPDATAWRLAIAGTFALAGIAWLHWRDDEARVFLRLATLALAAGFIAGIATIWVRSALVGTPPIATPMIGPVEGRVLAREEQPAENRLRLTLAVRETTSQRAVKVRVNVPMAKDRPGLTEGALVRMGVRLMPPAPPLVPGGYDFARRAWFDGLAATGASYGDIVIMTPGSEGGSMARAQRALSAHVRERLGGSPGAIAAAFASGDRGAIHETDEVAMRDAGLTHLLSISGLHVSAVVAAVYLLAIRLLALWPWLTLRVRLPVVAAGAGALAGAVYTLLTGADVPTVRSCLGAGLVLLALAMGREPLSLRMVSVVAGIVLLLWPEALVGPSFQMSFCAVLAIVALHGAAPVRGFLAPREESWLARAGRRVLMLFVTGVVIEAVLAPVVLFHFHRAGLYGALANVVAIPLTTLAIMPLIALALLFDLAGLGGPAWWLAGQALELLLGIARFAAGQAGAVRLIPQIGTEAILLHIAGMLWLALWRGQLRLWGLAPVAVAGVMMLTTPAPDLLVARDGRQIGVPLDDGRLLVLREGEPTKPGYALETLREAAAVKGPSLAIDKSPAARCNADFCWLELQREGRTWSLLVARRKHYVEALPLIRACAEADIVIAARSLPRSCTPRWLKADRRFLAEHGGLVAYLTGTPRLVTVAQSQGQHGWWRPNVYPPRSNTGGPASSPTAARPKTFATTHPGT